MHIYLPSCLPATAQVAGMMGACGLLDCSSHYALVRVVNRKTNSKAASAVAMDRVFVVGRGTKASA